jgi:hypothetical protein
MTSGMNRRLARLEAIKPPPLRQRFVWWKKGDPKPETEPGEELILLTWVWDDDDETPADVQAAPQEAAQ